MDAWLPTYHRLLAASPAPDQTVANETGKDAALSCQDQEHNLFLTHKYSLVSAETNPFSIMSGDTHVQHKYGKGENAHQKQAFSKHVGSYVAPGAENINIDKVPTFADQVALANSQQTRLNAGVATETAEAATPSLTCQIESCCKLVKAHVGGGHCNFSILSGLTKGCGKSFCYDHSGSKITDEDDDDFKANNYDEEQGPSSLSPFDQSARDFSIISSRQSDDGDRSFGSSALGSNMNHRQSARKTTSNAYSKEKKPFDGQVCQECQPRLRRTFKISMAVLCGVPALVSLVCLTVLGGSA